MLVHQFALGFLMILLTVVVHGVALDRLIFVLEKYRPYLQLPQSPMLLSRAILVMVVTIFCVFLSHLVQVWGWAACYQILGVLPDFEAAMYFSMSAFTTVGFGDIYLDESWRLLSAFEAANGFILFGWSTAFIFEVMKHVYTPEV
ncbi:two pore domain potassium channel family protein [bacterium SCSIO 12696]|nr:two pore domain potassium channel family protein [bacterium SCSIO 12696]